MEMERGYKAGKKFVRLLIYIFILIIFIGFNFQDTRVGTWNPQYVYNTNGQSIRDMAFSDSLTGFIITWKPYDYPGRVYKTNDGGNNWSLNISFDTVFLYKIQPINNDSILICEGNSILKTTNKGINWSRLFFPGYPYNTMSARYMHIINYDTIWVSCGTGFNQPQMYLTTNGGLNWILKFQLSSGVEFSRVYFYSKRIGFCCTGSKTYKTTDGGDNWFQLTNEIFKKMIFVDSITGWKCETFNYSMKKTTDGGYNWVTQILPSGGLISASYMFDFDVLNKDTLWGVGGSIYYPPPFSKYRGIIWKTTNGGLNWGYQLPDTGIVRFGGYSHIEFLNKNNGWAYNSDSTSYINMGGIYTVTGGLDTTIYVGIKEPNRSVSSGFELYQNYPNPFNSTTNIKVQMLKRGYAEIRIYDITGKLIKTSIKKNLNAGEHNFKFEALDLTSGVYFYSLFVDGIRVDTKKMVIIY